MGRPQFAQVGTKGGGQTVAMQDRPVPENVDASVTTGSVAAGNTEETTITAPADAIYRPIAARWDVSADPDATSGSHFLKIVPQNSGVRALQGDANFDQSIIWNQSEWDASNLSNARPSDGAAATKAFLALVAEASKGLTMQYTNSTDAAQENDRTYKFAFERRDL